MAKIIEKMEYKDLLSNVSQEVFENDIIGLPENNVLKEAEVDKMDEIRDNIQYRESILKRMSKNDKKSYNKGVIKLDLTCSNCGRTFQVQMTHKQYHNLLLLHMDRITREKRVASGTEVASLLTSIGASLPVREVFLFELCPACISKWKCQRLGNNATNVEKTSL